jgi:hypothetical protein
MDKFLAFVGKFFSREFLLAVAVVFGAIAEAGVLPPDSLVLKTITLALAVLTALGYGVVRTVQKAKGV